jgi:S1-C subfamily serine protease
MRRLMLLFVGVVLAAVYPPVLNAQVTSNVLTRVLMIRVGNSTGTGFTMEVDGRQYLITAKHVVSNLKPEGLIEIFKDDRWVPIAVKKFLCDDPIDIAVLIPPAQLTATFTFKPTTDGLFFGQDALFLGFPYGWFMSGGSANSLYPFALIKRGIISAIVKEKGISIVLLDGYNNPGFSGGPMVYRDMNQPKLVFNVAGVVSGFPYEFVPVAKSRVIKPGDGRSVDPSRITTLQDGRRVEVLEDSDLLAKVNTGIVLGYNIQYAVDLINKHPIGPKVSK